MTAVCPDCGRALPKDAALMGLCPQCLLSMALEDEEPETLHGEGPGRILGERYQIREVLGRGGMDSPLLVKRKQSLLDFPAGGF